MSVFSYPESHSTTVQNQYPMSKKFVNILLIAFSQIFLLLGALMKLENRGSWSTVFLVIGLSLIGVLITYNVVIRQR